MKILLKIRFNGAAYCGFQAQPDGRAVQNVLTAAFSDLFGFPCDITGCSRTDSGVHALGFCATVAPHDVPYAEDWCPIPAGKIHRAVNTRLPDDIAVTAASVVPDSFHPRYDVLSKEYEYRIYDTPCRDPFFDRLAYHSVRKITDESVYRMNECAALFCGRQNFAAFMATGSKITDPVRTVYAASVSRDNDGLIRYRVQADGFLYNMVRIMTGTLLEAAYGTRTPQQITDALMTGDRRLAGFTAPPCGLYLSHVTYNRDIQWLCD